MALCQLGFQARQALILRPENVACTSTSSRFRLQVCSALRQKASLPLKKHEQPGNLLEELEEEIKPFLELRLLQESRLRALKHYEIMYLVHEAKVDELQDIMNKFTDFVKEKNGRIFRLNDWGMRRLAYRIQKTWRANYVLMNIQIAPLFINELNMLMERDPRIIRHLVMTKKKGETEPTVPPEELPPSRAELLQAQFAAEDEAEAEAEREAQEAKLAERRARKAAALAQTNLNVKELMTDGADDDVDEDELDETFQGEDDERDDESEQINSEEDDESLGSEEEEEESEEEEEEEDWSDESDEGEAAERKNKK